MKKCVLVIVLLSVALVASNVYWFLALADAGITLAHRQDSWERHHKALAQAMDVAPVAARASATREEVLQAARAASDGDEAFDKEGMTWIGELGYRFDEHGRLVELQTNWSPF